MVSKHIRKWIREKIAVIIGRMYQMVETKEKIEHHLVNERPWGSYIVIERSEEYRIKRLKINPKQRLSLQEHRFRSEHWVVVKGTAEVQIGKQIWNIKNGASVFVSAGTRHRIANPNDTPLEIIEVQIGQVDESDIERFEDDYGREICTIQ